jgi:hypothetical protein
LTRISTKRYVALYRTSGHAPQGRPRGPRLLITPSTLSTLSAVGHIPTKIERRTLMAGDKTTLPAARIDVALKQRLERYAESQERPVSWVIRKAIIEYLDRHEE